MSAATLPAFD